MIYLTLLNHKQKLLTKGVVRPKLPMLATAQIRFRGRLFLIIALCSFTPTDPHLSIASCHRPNA
jgi:hypothetical protein